jgi:transposase-like protein
MEFLEVDCETLAPRPDGKGIEGFWSYAKERLLKYHGLKEENFPYYLKELEFRYNNRSENLFEKILELLKVE